MTSFLNRLDRASLFRNRVIREYDERNLLVAEHRPLEATSVYELDDMGDRLRTVYPEGREVAWTYDARRRVVTETRGLDETTTSGYDGNGNRRG